MDIQHIAQANARHNRWMCRVGIGDALAPEFLWLLYIVKSDSAAGSPKKRANKKWTGLFGDSSSLLDSGAFGASGTKKTTMCAMCICDSGPVPMGKRVWMQLSWRPQRVKSRVECRKSVWGSKSRYIVIHTASMYLSGRRLQHTATEQTATWPSQRSVSS